MSQRDIGLLLIKMRNKDAEIQRLTALTREQASSGNVWKAKAEENAETNKRLVRMVADLMAGNGDVCLDEAHIAMLREALESELYIKLQECQKELKAQKERYESEIAALKKIIQKQGALGDSSLLAKCDSLQHQCDNLRQAQFGQKTESKFHGRNAVDADSSDLAGEDTPQSEFSVSNKTLDRAVELVKERHTGKGKPKPRRTQPILDLAKENLLVPKGLPSDAVRCGEDVSYRISYVSGYIRAVKTIRPKYRDGEGRIYQVKMPHRNPMGHSQIDESVVAAILEKHFIEHVTLGDIERWLARMGLNFAHGTVMRWIEAAAEKLNPLDDILQHTLQSAKNQHSDETPVSVCDSEIAKEGEEQSDDRHYYTRWLFAHMAPELKLVQYKFFERGRRNREAIQDYMKNVAEKTWLHTDGAPLYKCYDVGETVVRVACAVHMRRPFWKLRGSSAEADMLVDLFNDLFLQERIIKSLTDNKDERKKLRNERIASILLEIKTHLDRLAAELEKENDHDLFKAVSYALKEYPCLLHCLEDGSLEWSNNVCEQQMRTIAAYRNASNALGSVDSAERFARLMSYAQSCRLNMIDFGDWAADILRRLSDGEVASADMLPNTWQQTTENVNLLNFSCQNLD